MGPEKPGQRKLLPFTSGNGLSFLNSVNVLSGPPMHKALGEK